MLADRALIPPMLINLIELGFELGGGTAVEVEVGPSFDRASVPPGIRSSADHRSTKNHVFTTWHIFVYIHSATSAKLWIYAY